MYSNERPHVTLGYLTPVELLLKYGKLNPLNQSHFPTLQRDNNSNNESNSLFLNVSSWGKTTSWQTRYGMKIIYE